ncbi:MAG: VWA domain-containing protein [Myxococcota bacterium]
MNPAQPLALVLGALALPLIAAYLHRRRRTPQRVPSAILFRRIAGPQTPTSRAMAKPRHLLSLLLVLLALIGLIAALADLQREGEQPRAYVVVLDTSASMGTQGIGDERTRLQTGVDRLEESLSRLGSRDRVALVTTGADTQVKLGFTEDHARIIEVARSLTPAGTSDASASALRIADAMCRATEDAAIVLISDGTGVSAPSTRCPIEHVAVGRVGPNVGITALSVREADALGLAEVYLAVTADRDAEGQVDVKIELDGHLMDVVSVDVPASGEAKKLHRVALPPGKRVSARLDNVPADTLPDDNVAWTPRRIGGQVRVLLVSTTRLSFTAEALRLHPRVELTVIGPNDEVPDPDYDLIVLETPRAAAKLPASRHVLALGVDPIDFGIASRGAVEDPEIVRWDFDDALFRFVSFDRIQLPATLVFVPTETQDALVDSDAGPIAVSTTWEDRRVIAFGFSPHASDFVLRVGFVNFVANAIEWAAPPLPALADGEAEQFAMATTESRVTPPPQIAGTTRGDFSGPVRKDLPVWQWLVWAAAALMLLEWFLPALAMGITPIVGRLRARRGPRRPRRKPADKDPAKEGQ